jgi:hypothetical protein
MPRCSDNWVPSRSPGRPLPGKISSEMRIVSRILGILLVILGCIWFLQGVNVLPGSFMTGQIRWAVYGAIAVVVGFALLFAARRRTVKG